MIVITRRHADHLLAAFRPRTFRGARHLVLRADPAAGLRVRAAAPEVAAEYALPGPPRPRETLLLPIGALSHLAAHQDSPVILRAAGPRAVEASWDFHWIGERRTYAVPRYRSLPRFPEPPAALAEAPVELLDAIVMMGVSYLPEGRVVLAGGSDRVADLHGDEVRLPEGYRLPWRRAVSVASSGVLYGPALRRGPLGVGLTATHVVLRSGPWTVWLAARGHDPRAAAGLGGGDAGA